jgi:hypothetical protein
MGRENITHFLLCLWGGYYLLSIECPYYPTCIVGKADMLPCSQNQAIVRVDRLPRSQGPAMAAGRCSHPPPPATGVGRRRRLPPAEIGYASTIYMPLPKAISYTATSVAVIRSKDFDYPLGYPYPLDNTQYFWVWAI